MLKLVRSLSPSLKPGLLVAVFVVGLFGFGAAELQQIVSEDNAGDTQSATSGQSEQEAGRPHASTSTGGGNLQSVAENRLLGITRAS